MKLCQQSFSTFKPEVIKDIFVFDWEVWFQPWMRALENHSHYRAFQFRRNPTNPTSVLMKYKMSESSTEEFHGSPTHPEGIEILLEMPPGFPNRILPTDIDVTRIPEIEATYKNLTGEQRMWWEELLETNTLPDTQIPTLPEEYKNYERFNYAIWEEQHPYQHQIPVAHNRVVPPIEVDEVTGISAIGDRVIELLPGDHVTMRTNEQDVFWLGKIRRIVPPPGGETSNLVHYRVWFYEQMKETDDIWKHTTKWKLMNARQGDAYGIFTINHFLTVKFLPTRTKCLRKDTLRLIRQVMDIDNTNEANVATNETEDTADPEEHNTNENMHATSEGETDHNNITQSTENSASEATSESTSESTSDSSSDSSLPNELNSDDNVDHEVEEPRRKSQRTTRGKNPTLSKSYIMSK